MKLLFILLSALRTVDAHGAMNVPRERNMGNGLWPKPTPSGGSMNIAGCDGAACMWFNQGW